MGIIINFDNEEEEEDSYTEPSTYIIPQCKRGAGKIKGALGVRDMYKYYKSITPKDELIDYKTFIMITKKCNEELLHQVVNESEILELPYRLGKLQIAKFERQFNPEKPYKWAIDYKRSKIEGMKVFHEQKNIYSWRWKKHYAIVINKTGYKFIACRKAKRMVAPALKTGRDYYKL